MLEALITSKTRIKLLLKFFLNPSTSAHLRGLATEFNESSNAIRLELNRLEDAGMLTTVSEGNKKLFQVNKKHALFNSYNKL
jgi:DeoR/GlpR family transcriptional regulator of sugar metabolism